MPDTDDQPTPDEKPVSTMITRLGAGWFGFPSQLVLEVFPCPTVYPVPTTPAYVPGVVNLRSRVIPVLDLTVFLEVPMGELSWDDDGDDDGGEVDSSSRVAVVEAHGMEVGILVGDSCEVVDLPAASIKEPHLAAGKTLTYSTGEARLGTRVVALLDLHRILEDSRT